jgi:hypothetical protein
VRAEIAGRKSPWTAPELEASLPRLLDSAGWKLTASHGGDTAAGAATLRGWSSGVPQTAGMSLTVELPQAVLLTELQFDSIASAGGRGGRGGLAPAPIVGYPRAYTVQLAADNKKWSKPVAEGKGEGSHTAIAFAPTRAKFIRITQTDSAADAPPWSIRNLRLYEARPDAGTK